MTQNNRLEAIKVTQGNQEFLISVIDVKTLKKYTRYTERLIVAFDDENLPIYNPQVQRRTDTTKVNAIADYLLNDPKAMFPTNIVLAIPKSIVDSYVDDNNNVTIELNEIVEKQLQRPDGDVYISVIDGQHRLKGLEIAIDRLHKQVVDAEFMTEAKKKTISIQLENLLKFQVSVTFFIDPVIDYQASIFSIINRTQTKVSESLVYSLFGLTDKSSPQKTSLDVILALNSFKSSPLFNKVKLVGGGYKRGESPILTQAAAVKALIKCICPTLRQAEVERFSIRKELLKGINNDLCFRKYYASDEDGKISKSLFAYFKAVEKTFILDGLSLWKSSDINNILNTTIGYETLIDLLKYIIVTIPDDDSRFDISVYESLLVKAKDINFQDDERYRKTSSSKKILLADLRKVINI